jgi:pilus assembly protein CpaE
LNESARNMGKPSVLVLGADQRVQAEIHRALKDIATVASAPATETHNLKEYILSAPGAVLVCVGNDPRGSFGVVSELCAGGLRVIVVSSSKDPDLILQAMRAGAREFVLDGDHEGLRRAVREQARTPEGESPRGSVMTLFPTRGGVGATSIATNVAGALQRRGESVCLLDFDLYLGDVLSFLDLPGTFSITDVLANMSRLDRDLLDTSVMRHPSGVRVLAQSGKVEEAEHVRPADMPSLFGFLRRHYDRIVVDGVRGFDEMSLAVLDASQKIVMILTQDVPAVRNTKRCLDLFRRLGYGEGKIMLVLNRFQKDSKITPDVIAETVGCPVSHTVGNDFAAAIESINRGLLLYDASPRSRLTKDIEALAPVLSGQAKEAGRRGGFLWNLLTKRENGAPGTS